jgi:hypothetical protein
MLNYATSVVAGGPQQGGAAGFSADLEPGAQQEVSEDGQHSFSRIDVIFMVSTCTLSCIMHAFKLHNVINFSPQNNNRPWRSPH